MAGDLQDLMRGAAEAKLRTFADEDFAGGYGRSVIGRVKRRRAASATAMGGGTVVAVGALAVGASTVPWGTFVFGASPTSSPSVVCATTTSPPVADFPPKIFTFTDPTDGSSASVAHYADGTVELEPGGGSLVHIDDGDYRLTLPNGAEATIAFAMLAIGLPEGADPTDYFTVAVFDGDVTVTSERGPSPAPSPSTAVTCVNREPEPSNSASPSASAEPSTDPTPPFWGEWPEVPAGPSPFECGFEFSGPSGSTGVIEIGEPEWLLPSDAALRVREFDQGNNTPEFIEGNVPVFPYSSGDNWPGAQLGGSYSWTDPADNAGAWEFDVDGGQVYAGFVDGVQFVLARDGVVVATFADLGETSGATRGVNINPSGNGVFYSLNLDSGFTACDGVDASTIAEAQPVAVAGIAIIDGGEKVVGPYYAWRFVEPKD